jgi:hypothetical protein
MFVLEHDLVQPTMSVDISQIKKERKKERRKERIKGAMT